MFLARLAVRRPVLTAMFILLFVVVGIRSFFQLPQELRPNIEFPFVLVQTIYPGAGPKEVESQITKLIEDEVGSISNLRNLQSTSQEGLSFIFMEFELGSNADLKAIEVKDKIELIRSRLPEDAKPPAVFKFDFADWPIMTLAISSPRSLEETYRIADQRIQDILATVDGVSSVDILGGRQREIRVALRREALRAYGLSVTDVVQALAMENLNFPVGRIISDSSELSLRLQAQFQTLDEIRKVRMTTPSGATIYLQDLGRVLDSHVEQRDMARFEGAETVSLEVRKKRDSNMVAVSDGVQEKVKELEQTLPKDIRINIVRDNSNYVRDSVSDATSSIIIGIILTAILLFLFLHDLRTTFIASISIPAAIIATFMPMLFADFTINIISLLALGVAVGVLVANAIVVLESIASRVKQGMPADQAAIEGTGSVSIAIIASTATNLVVFTPIAFMEGIIGQFMMQFGITVVFATILSLIMSFTLVPMLAAKLYAGGIERKHFAPIQWFATKWDNGYESFAESYKRSLQFFLRHRWVVVLGTVVILAGGIMLFGFIGSDFFPQSDQNELYVALKLPAGTSLKKTDEVLREIDGIVRDNFGDTIISGLQGIGGQMKGVEEGSLTYKLIDKAEREMSSKEIVNHLRPMLAVIPAAEIRVDVEASDRGPSSGLQIEITGPDIQGIDNLAQQVIAQVKQVPDLVDVQSSYVQGKQELTFKPDRDQLAAYGAPTGLIGTALRYLFEGEIASRYKEMDEEYDIRVQLEEDERQESTDFSDIFLRVGPNYVPISQLGEMEYSVAETEIQRKDKQRVIFVTASVASGSIGEAQGKLQKLIEENIQTPSGYRIYFGGTSEWMAETFQSIFEALILAIILTFMVLAATLESVVHPFTIMLTLPLGLIGVSLSLFLSGISLNIMSLMAIVMLVGIVVNNAILILDMTAQLRSKGWRICEALAEAASIRLRPIIMMNSAIAISLAPQVLSGSGAEFRAALAMVTIGGVLVSSVFTLYLIPVVYTYLDRLAKPPKLEPGAVADSLPAEGDESCDIV